MSSPVDDAKAAAIDWAVRNLIGRYCAAVAEFSPERFAACWALDAEWVAKGNVITGRDRIVRVFARLREPFALCVQEPLSGVLDVESAESATAQWQIRELQFPGGGAPGTQLLGIYTDRYAPVDGRWCFARREFRELFRGPLDTTGTLAGEG